MLEKANLKSQFYLDHTFYSPIHQQVSFKNLQEAHTNIHISKSKAPKKALNLTSNHKIDISFQEDPNIQDLNRSLNFQSKNSENFILKSSKRPKIPCFYPNSIKAKSVGGIKIKKLKNSENFKQTKNCPRVQTPYFNKRCKNNLGELNEVCDKPMQDHPRMKKTIKQSNFSPTRELSDLYSPKLQLSSFPKIFRFDTLNNSIKPNEKLNHADNLLRSSISPIDQNIRFNSPNPTHTEADLTRLKILQQGRHSIRVSKKYYKDQPKIKSVLGVPKEVFTPKHCN